MVDLLIDEEARLPPQLQIADHEELVLVDPLQGQLPPARLAAAPLRQVPTHMKSVARPDAFILADGDPVGHVDLDLNRRGGGHGSIPAKIGRLPAALYLISRRTSRSALRMR